MSGGGFLFDTGAHMLNTVSDLAGEDFARGRRLARGRRPPGRHPGRHHGPARVGRARHDERLRQRDPLVRLGDPGVLRPGQSSAPGSGASASSCSEPVPAACARSGPWPPMPVWEQFLERPGRPEPNPSPPEVGPADGPPVGRDPRVVGARRRGDRPWHHARRRPRISPRHDRPMTRVTVWSEYRQERSDPAGPSGLSGRHPRRDRRGAARAPASTSGRRPSTSRSTA